MVQPVSCLKDAYRPRISSAPTRKPSAEPDVAAGSSSAIGQYASCDQRQLAADPWSEKTHRSDSRVTFSADTTEISNVSTLNIGMKNTSCLSSDLQTKYCKSAYGGKLEKCSRLACYKRTQHEYNSFVSTCR